MLNTIILSLALLFSTDSTDENTAESYSVNPEKSAINWVGKKVTGQHNGTVELKDGSLNIKDGKLEGGSFEIDMTSILVTDLEGEWKDKLEGHLKSPDFFATEKYPTSKFVITKVKAEGAGKYLVTGEASIKGITKKIDFPTQIVLTDNQVIGTASIVIDRSEFNVQYGSGSFFDDLGDKTIYDDFELSVKIVAAR